MRRLILPVAILGVIAIALIAYIVDSGADSKPKVAIYTLVSHPILDDSIEGIKEGLADEGYGEDTIGIIELNANGETDKLNAFAKELLAIDPAVIVPISTAVTQAVFHEAAQDQKIVFSTVTNPSDVGMNEEPNNMTGVCDSVNYEANFDLIFELFPETQSIGIIYNAGEQNSQYGVRRFKQLVDAHGDVELELVTASQSQEVVDAARSLVTNVDIIYVGSDNTVVEAMAGLTQVAYEADTPVVASDSGSVENGALAAVSVDYKELGRRAGQIVAEVLRTGRMLEDTAPVIFVGNTLVINEKAAKRLGYQFSVGVREKADQIIQ